MHINKQVFIHFSFRTIKCYDAELYGKYKQLIFNRMSVDRFNK